MSAAHTPGPWQALNPDKVGEVAISYRHNGHDLICAHVYDGPEFGSALANARLIAAAPDLLAASEQYLDALIALNEAVKYGDSEDANDDEYIGLNATAELAYRNLRAAITKARGQS